MINNQLHITSSLLRERNIQEVFSSHNGAPHSGKTCYLQKESGKDTLNLCAMFKKVLLETALGSGTISGICTDLMPFCEYLMEIHGITDITGITRSHVEAYVTAVRSAYESGNKRPRDVFRANMRFTALSLMCLYLHRAGAVAEDYGKTLSLIPYPDVAEQVQ